MTINNSLPAWTKWALAAVAVAVIGLAIAYEELDVERHVPIEDFPAPAREFMNASFAEQKVVLSKSEHEHFCKNYEVILDGGIKIEFNRRGEWKKVDCKYAAVPKEIMPRQITEFLTAEYPENRVTEIERKGSRIEVELDGRTELIFDKNCNLVGFDD